MRSGRRRLPSGLTTRLKTVAVTRARRVRSPRRGARPPAGDGDQRRPKRARASSSRPRARAATSRDRASASASGRGGVGARSRRSTSSSTRGAAPARVPGSRSSPPEHPMSARRLAAGAALLVGGAAVGVGRVRAPARPLAVAGLSSARGDRRLVGDRRRGRRLAVGARDRRQLWSVAAVLFMGGGSSRTRFSSARCSSAGVHALGVRHPVLLPRRPAPHPVLFLNPRSGGGKAERFALGRRARARHRGRRPRARRRPRDARARRVAAGPTGSRWRAATARRRSSRGRRRARPALRVHPGGDPQPLRARPRGGSQRRRRGARRVRRAAASGGSTSPRSTGACSSTTSRSASTRGGAARRLPRARSCGRCSTRFPSARARRARRSTCAWTGPSGHEHARAR